MKKSLIFGFITGFVLSLLILAVIVPQYSDYIAKSQASAWQSEFEQSNVAKQIENQLLANQPVTADTTNLKISFVKFAKVNALGEVTLKGEKYGQLMVLMPSKQDGKIVWTCLGGSDKDVPSNCYGNVP